MSFFKDRVLMITGGIGSFGSTVLRRFITTDINEIRVFSRDEKKQEDLRHELQAKYPKESEKVTFYIGDVRSLESCRRAMHDVDSMCAMVAEKRIRMESNNHF